jgi:hypothetical protein
MTHEQLDQIIAKSPDDIRERLGELHTAILQAAAAKLSETQDSEKAAVLNIAISLKIDLAMSPPTWKAIAKVGATYTSEGAEHATDEGPDLGLQVEMGRRAK